MKKKVAVGVGIEANGSGCSRDKMKIISKVDGHGGHMRKMDS